MAGQDTARRDVLRDGAALALAGGAGGVTAALADDAAVPPLAPEIRLVPPATEFTYEAIVDIAPTVAIGAAPLGMRAMVPILGGQFAGPRLRGKVLPGGADRQLLRADGVKLLDALYELQADDGAVITVRNRVLIDAPPGGPRYAFSMLEITAPEGPHAWLNRGVFVGTLHGLMPQRQAVLIRVFRVV
jgi:hypothetical protein